MTRFTVRKSKGFCTLTAEGSLTIECAEAFKSSLVKAMDSNNKIIIKGDGTEAVDLTAVQILCAAHKTAASSKKELIIDDQLLEIFKDSIQWSGLSLKSLCVSGKHKAECMWLTGGCS